MERKDRQCLGCARTFTPRRPNQAYHAAWCQKRHNSSKPQGERAGYPLPSVGLINSFRLSVVESKPEGAIGFRLYCRELDISLPQPGSPRRDGRRPRSEDFRLDPLEYPLLPLITSYAVTWVYEGGVAHTAHPIQMVSPGWVDDMRNMGEVGRRLRLYLQRRREQSLANRRLIEHQAKNMQPLLTPGDLTADLPQLPPHEQGHSDDDTGTP